MRPGFATALFAAGLAVAAPTLLPFGSLPLTSLPTDVMALAGWGAWIAFASARTAASGQPSLAEPGLKALLGLLAVLSLAALCSAAFAGGPPRLVARQVAVMACAAAALLLGARLMQRAACGGLQHFDLIRALLLALLLAGAMNAAIAVAQYAAPGSTWVPLSDSTRAVGHLRQPNLLATQLLWSLLALAALRETGRFPGWLFAALGALMIVALAMTASRTGAVACLLPALWGLCDRRLSRRTRAALVAAPLLLALCWWGVTVFPPDIASRSDGAALLNRANLNTTRWGLWQQALRLIGQNPLLGVGWGQFAFAWTLTPMVPIARSPYETFTHSHNLLLQWAVELGLPLAFALTALLLWAGWRALLLTRHAEGAEGTVRSAALVMVAVVLLHSMLEFPLWHVNFLLVSACLFGLALGGGGAGARGPAEGRSGWAKARPTLVGGLIALSALVALYDYQAIANVYAPPNDGLSDDQRVVRARRSVLFGQFGDRFAGTLARVGTRQVEPYREIVFEHLDLQLLLSWTLAQAEAGHADKARYLAARLKEFDRPEVQRFFEVCATPQGAAAFQCSPPPPGLSFRDFK
jgi:O-antigen ligase